MYIVGTSHCKNETYQPDYEFMPGEEYSSVDEFIDCALSCLDDFPNELDCSRVAEKLRTGDYTLEEVESGYFEISVEYYR